VLQCVEAGQNLLRFFSLVQLSVNGVHQRRGADPSLFRATGRRRA